MRLLCVARHAFLSEHLCRYFGSIGAHCEPATGLNEAASVASTFEPHLIVAESDLLGPAALDAWASQQGIAEVPVLAVSLSKRPDESMPVEMSGLAGVIYLPAMEREKLLAVLEGAWKPSGVAIPKGALEATMREPAAVT